MPSAYIRHINYKCARQKYLCENSAMTRSAYTILLYLLLPFTPLKLLWRARKQSEYLQHWRERYGFYKQKPSQAVIWMHCVSVGETRAAAPLISALLAQYPQHQILLTHTTPTGRATSEQLFGDSVHRVYLPYDVPCATKRFVRHFKPAIGMLMETELWFNLIAACKQQSVPLLLINARLSEKSAHGYDKLGKLVKEGLQGLTAISAQTSADAQRLQTLGAANISVSGNLKFDVIPPTSAAALGQQLRKQLGLARPILLAASTREGEEALIIEAAAHANIEGLLTIIVPRHPQRFDEVELLLKKRKLNFLRKSALLENQTISPEMAYVLGDSMGEMFNYYAACDLAFIGGSLLDFGGQNLIEACAMGKPVIIGKYTYNFEQATTLAIAAGAAVRVEDDAGLTRAIASLFKQPARQQQMAQAALAFSAESRGASAKTLALINTRLQSHIS